MPSRFQNILPDPNYTITPGGFDGNDASGGVAGQPFSSVTLSESREFMQDRTHSGKLINRSQQLGRWSIKIAYNPMTRQDFEPVYNFLMEKRGTKKPFFISLPQNSRPASDAFNDYLIANPGTISSSLAASPAGITSMELFGPSAWNTPAYNTTGLPSVGDLFTFPASSGNPSLHTKAYKITFVETELLYETIPSPGRIRIHFTPGLHIPWGGGFTSLKPEFIDPLIKVTQIQDIQEYSLGNNGLYSFSLRLKEALY